MGLKYIVVLGDGMADYPIAALGDLTPCSMPELQTWISWLRLDNWVW